MENKRLRFKKLGTEIPLARTPGGHFIIPVKSVINSKDPSEQEDDLKEVRNIKGQEAEAVILVLLAITENEEDLGNLHNKIGHDIFVALAMTDDEEAPVKKIHRYFGYRSGRRISELFFKADRLKGKKQAVLDMIAKCKICSEMKKSPPRPKVGLQMT